MPASKDEVVGFPRAWQPFYDATVAAEMVHRVNAVQQIFSMLGVSIHEVVDSEKTRWAVQVLWKGYKEFLRGYEASALQSWEEYLLWVERQTGQAFKDRALPRVRLRELIATLAEGWRRK